MINAQKLISGFLRPEDSLPYTIGWKVYFFSLGTNGQNNVFQRLQLSIEMHSFVGKYCCKTGHKYTEDLKEQVLKDTRPQGKLAKELDKSTEISTS